MNILYEKLPDTICIDNKEYPVHTDFRRWIEIEILLSEDICAESISKIIMLCYKALPVDLKTAIRGIISFHSMGEVNTKPPSIDKKSVYSYKHDSGYIYSAFFEKYGIDLTACSLHWYQFRTLLQGLGECRFTKIMEYRAMDTDKLKSKEQKQFYRKMQRLYALPSEHNDIAEAISDLF